MRFLDSLWRRIFILMITAAACAAVMNAASPNRIPWTGNVAIATPIEFDTLSLAEVRDAISQGKHIVFDARSSRSFEAGHVPASLNFPPERIDELFPQMQVLLTPQQPILVYCSGASCDQSLKLARFLKAQGYGNVKIFSGGMTEWKKAKLPVEVGP